MYTLMIDAHIPIFKEPSMYMNINQKNLISWMRYYYNVVFSLDEKDRPSDFIIDYDILLDDWLERKRFKETVKTPDRKISSAEDMNYIVRF